MFALTFHKGLSVETWALVKYEQVLQRGANKTVPLSFYKHVNVLEHLRGNPRADRVSGDGEMDG